MDRRQLLWHSMWAVIEGVCLWILNKRGIHQDATVDVDSDVQPLSDAMLSLKHHIQNDDDYARAWHDNLAMAFFDAGVEIDYANEGARIFMQRVFKV